jgi:hypothetical protein
MCGPKLPANKKMAVSTEYKLNACCPLTWLQEISGYDLQPTSRNVKQDIARRNPY